MVRWALLPLISLTAYADEGGGDWHMMDLWHRGTGWHGGMLMWILFLAVIGLLVYLIVQGVQGKSTSQEEMPLQILKKRYARGEISMEEYEGMKRDLED